MPLNYNRCWLMVKVFYGCMHQEVGIPRVFSASLKRTGLKPSWSNKAQTMVVSGPKKSGFPGKGTPWPVSVTHKLTTLLTITSRWKQPKCASVYEWIHNVIYGILPSLEKEENSDTHYNRDELWKFVTEWSKLQKDILWFCFYEVPRVII